MLNFQNTKHTDSKLAVIQSSILMLKRTHLIQNIIYISISYLMVFILTLLLM